MPSSGPTHSRSDSVVGVRPLAPALPGAAVVLLAAGVAGAQPAPADPAQAPPAGLTADTKIDFSTEAPEGKTSNTPEPAPGQEVDAGPPLRPRHNGLVLESTLGVLGFVGEFRHVSPPAYWLHMQLGYEVLPWLMLFGEGELAYTDTSEVEDPSHATAFSIWGFGGGARATVHATDRVAFFGQASADALGANVPHDTLAIVGFRTAESLNASFGVRVGVEWYQMDRHMALALQVGARDAQGFQKFLDNSDFPLMWDAAAGLRYTF
jgi:hypothetical protein